MTAATPVVSLLAGGILCGGLLLGGLGGHVYRRRSTPGSTWFARLLGVLGAGTLAAVAVGFATGFDGIGWLGVLYAVVLLTPIPWIGFVAEFTGRGGLLGSRRLALLSVPLFAGVVITFAPTFIDSPGPAFLIGTLSVFFYGVMLVFVGAALLIRTTYLYAHLSVVQGIAPSVALVEPWFFLTVLFQSTGLSTGLAVGIAAAGMGLTAGLLAASVLWLGLLETAAAAGNIGTEAVVQEIDEVVVVVDDEHKVVTLNDAARETLGLAGSEGLGSDLDAVVGLGVETLAADRTVDLFTASGYRTFRTGTSRLLDQHGEEFGTVITLADVTGREIRQEQLRVLNRVLRHNLRNEMDVVEALAGAIESQPDIERRIARTADDLLETSERAREVEEVIGTGAVSRSTVRVGDLTASIVAGVRRRYPAVTVEEAVPTDRTVHTDRTILRYVLSNLLENAAEHNDADDPRVSVTVTGDRRDGAEMVEIAVADNGPGISEHEREAIETGEETELRHGSGLGLWAAKWGARILGGTLRFDANDPRGTVVSVTLPVNSGDGAVEGGDPGE
jgi:signal transduction histidine kinase